MEVPGGMGQGQPSYGGYGPPQPPPSGHAHAHGPHTGHSHGQSAPHGYLQPAPSLPAAGYAQQPTFPAQGYPQSAPSFPPAGYSQPPSSFPAQGYPQSAQSFPAAGHSQPAPAYPAGAGYATAPQGVAVASVTDQQSAGGFHPPPPPPTMVQPMYEAPGESARPRYKQPPLAKFAEGARQVLHSPQSRPIVILSSTLLSLAALQFKCAWDYNSQALVGYTLIDAFNGISVASELAVIWVSKQPSDLSHSYGYAQCNVVAAFSLCVLQGLVVVWNFFECLEHVVVPAHHDHPDQLSMWVLWLALFTRVLGMLAVRRNSPVHRTVPEAQNSTIKHTVAAAVHATLGSGRLHRMVLLSRAFSLPLIMFALSWVMLFVAGTQSVDEDTAWIDSICSVSIATCGMAATWPYLMHHTRILLLASPIESSTLWAKCLRDASSLPGVLEIKNEHIWQNGHSESVGSLHVRIAQDADPQMALAKVVALFSHVCTHLTVEVKKDEWRSPMVTNTRIPGLLQAQTQGHAADNAHHGHGHSHGGPAVPPQPGPASVPFGLGLGPGPTGPIFDNHSHGAPGAAPSRPHSHFEFTPVNLV